MQIKENHIRIVAILLPIRYRITRDDTGLHSFGRF